MDTGRRINYAIVNRLHLFSERLSSRDYIALLIYSHFFSIPQLSLLLSDTEVYIISFSYSIYVTH